MKTFFAIFLIILCFSCSNRKADSPKITPEFLLSIAEKDEGYLFTIQTNLPDDTELIASLCDEIGGTILAQDKNFVSGGIAIFGPFRSREGKLSGEYILDITMSVMLVQHEKVKKILGINGENISGDLLFEEFGSVGIQKQFAINLTDTTIK